MASALPTALSLLPLFMYLFGDLISSALDKVLAVLANRAEWFNNQTQRRSGFSGGAVPV